mgnify:FL=1
MKVQDLKKNKKPRGRPKIIAYDKTLEIAMYAYWSKGIDGMSVNEVCRLANVSKPSLYREFGNEDSLHSEVLKHYAIGLHNKLTNLLSMHKTFNKTLHGLADFASFRRDQNITPKGCLAQKSFQAIDRLGEKSSKELEALGDKTLDIFKKWVSKARKEVKLHGDWDDREIAEYILSIFSHAMRMNDQEKNPEKIKKTMLMALSPLVTNS